MTKNYSINNKEQIQKSFEVMNEELAKIESGDVVYCNKYKKYYPDDDTFSCVHDDMTYHTYFMKIARDCSKVMEDNLKEYEATLDNNNYPEFDERIR